MSRESKLAKNTFILSIGTFLPKLASTITLPILTGYLTKEEFGTYDLVTVLVSLVLPAATLQIQTAAFRFLIDVRDDEEEIKKIITNIAVFIIPTSVIALAILFILLPGNYLTIRLLICLYFFADITVNAARQVARGLDRNIDYSISAIVSAIGKMVFAIVFVWWLRLGLKGSIIALFLASSLSFIFIMFKTKIYYYFDLSYFDKSKLLQMLEYSWPMVPNSMSVWVIRVSDRFVVTMFMGVAANAVYSVANKIPSLLNLAQNTFTMAWQENASIVSKDDDANAYYTSMFRTMFDLMAGFFGLLIALTPALFYILIRGDYDEAYNQMPILFLGMFFFSLASFLGGIYVAYMATKSVGVTTVIAAVFNIIIDLLLIQRIGLYAASISTLLSYMLLAIYRMIDIQKIVHIEFDIIHITIVLSILVLQSLLCYMQNNVCDILNLVLGILIFFALNKSLVITVLQRVNRYIK